MSIHRLLAIDVARTFARVTQPPDDSNVETDAQEDVIDLLTTSPRVINKLENLTGLSEQERQLLQPVTETFAFRVSPYYASLIDWSDERDPLRKIVLPK